MITREADYAIRTVLALAKRPRDAVVPTAELSQEMDIPFRFLRRIAGKLVRSGIVAAHRGNGGGLRLLLSPRGLTLLSVVAAVDSRSIKLNTCLVRKGNCPRSGHCSVHEELARLQEALEGMLGQVTFEKLVKKQ
ncbi:MAG: Rrf2 family transcriptional regulator [Planctomycetaceae bacterium]|nr:Rrf2 family transcriptional regulator [Planctomycetaceae bacterium]